LKLKRKCVVYLQLALAQEYPDAYASMASNYLHGTDVPVDKVRARSLLETGAKLGSQKAKFELDNWNLIS